MKLLHHKQKNLVYSTLALAMLLAFLWIYSETGSPPALPEKQGNTKEPEFFIKAMTTHNFDKQGNIKETLTANRVNSYNRGKRSELNNPVIHLFDNQQLSWQITANNGVVFQKDNRVELKKNVVVNSGDNNHILSTQALTIYPELDIAENKVAVTITSPQGTTTALGMKTDLKNQHTALKKNVKGHYHAATQDH